MNKLMRNYSNKKYTKDEKMNLIKMILDLKISIFLLFLSGIFFLIFKHRDLNFLITGIFNILISGILLFIY